MAMVGTSATTSIASPREGFYAWLVPGVFFDEMETVLRDSLLVSGVAKTTDTIGPWGVPGSHRILHFTDGNSAREVVTAGDAPGYFAYVVTEFTNPLIRRLVREVREQWWFTDEGAGTHAKWAVAFEAKSILAVPPLLPMVKIFWRRAMKATMKNIKERAEKEVTGGSK